MHDNLVPSRKPLTRPNRNGNEWKSKGINKYLNYLFGCHAAHCCLFQHLLAEKAAVETRTLRFATAIWPTDEK
jgi:hypothetical protein